MLGTASVNNTRVYEALHNNVRTVQAIQLAAKIINYVNLNSYLGSRTLKICSRYYALCESYNPRSITLYIIIDIKLTRRYDTRIQYLL